MQFPAGSLAILASKVGSDELSDGRSFIENWNRFHRYQKSNEDADGLSASHEKLRNKRGTPRMVTKIVNEIQKLRHVVECDPLAETEVEDYRRLSGQELSTSFTANHDNVDELGILAAPFSSPTCGVGRKCRKATSEEASSLGGICEDIDGWDYQEFLHRRGLQEASGNSTDSQGYDPNNIVQTMEFACENGGLVGYDCECDFDTGDAYVGTAVCTTPISCSTTESLCGVPVTDCYKSTYYVSLQGQRGIWDAEFCLEFLEPYAQTACYKTSTIDYGVTPNSECDISLDGEYCSSCEVYKFRDSNCYVFDCGNTSQSGKGHGTRSGNTCDFPAHGIGFFIESYGCPSCDICQSDSPLDPGMVMAMTEPENSVVFFNTTYDCDYVQQVSLAGLFTPDSCSYFAEIAGDACGCAAVKATDLVSTPAESDLPVTENIIVTTDSPTSAPIENGECKICPDGVSNPDGIISFPGSNASTNQISCAEVELAIMAGSISGNELCEAVQKEALGPCCGVAADEDETSIESVNESEPQSPPLVSMDGAESDHCTLCGDGKFHTEVGNSVSVPTQGIFTCQQLLDMGKNGTLDNKGICLLVQTLAQTPCGCKADGIITVPTEAPEASEEEATSSSSPLYSGTPALFVSAAATAFLVALSSWNFL